MKKLLTPLLIFLGLMAFTHAALGRELDMTLNLLIQEIFGFIEPGTLGFIAWMGTTAIEAGIAVSILINTKLMERLPENPHGLGKIKLPLLLIFAGTLMLTGTMMSGIQVGTGFLAPGLLIGQILLLVGIIQIFLAAAPLKTPIDAVNDEHF
jgi:hypothetical protein